MNYDLRNVKFYKLCITKPSNNIIWYKINNEHKKIK